MDSGLLAATIAPYVTAAVQTYGAATIDKVRDAATDESADATVSLGRRVLAVLLAHDRWERVVADAVADLATDPSDPDAIAVLRLQIRKALSTDSALEADIAAILPTQFTGNEASGYRSISISTNSGIVNTGDNATYHNR